MFTNHFAPFMVFAPDGEESGGEGDTFDWVSEMPIANGANDGFANVHAGEDDLKTADASEESESVETQGRAEETAAKATETLAAEKTEGNTGEPAKPAGVIEKPATGEIPEAIKSALLEAAKMAGVTETNPEKIPAAIAERKQQIEAESAAKVAADAAQQRKVVEQKIQTVAVNKVSALIDPQIELAMKADGWELGEGWRTNPANVEAFAEFERIRKDLVASDPKWEATYNDAVNSARGAVTEKDRTVNDLQTKYPLAAHELIKEWSQFDEATPQFLERLAQKTSAVVELNVAKLNSAISERDAKIASLEANLSDLDAKIAKAQADGKNEALAIVKEGRDLKVSNGVGTPVPQTGKFNIHDASDISLDDLPTDYKY